MSQQIVGKIDSIYTKTITIKNGARAGQDTQVYHAMINGHDVNLGFKHNFTEGESVTLNVEEKYGGYQVVQGNTAVANTGPVVGAPTTAAGTGAGGPSKVPSAFPVHPNANGTSIVRQSSLKAAIEVVDNMKRDGVVMLPLEEQYIEKVLEVAYIFTDFGTGQREVKQANAMACYTSED